MSHHIEKSHHTHKDHHQEAHDRAHAPGINPNHMKKGGGGKHNWGKLGDQYDDDEETLDPRDPNADDVYVPPKHSGDALRDRINDVAEKELAGALQAEVAKIIKSMDDKALHTLMPQRIVEWALKQPQHKASLLSFLHSLQEKRILSRDEVESSVVAVYAQTSSPKVGGVEKEEALTMTVLELDRVIT